MGISLISLGKRAKCWIIFLKRVKANFFPVSFFSCLIYDSFFLSLPLSGQNNERGCDDGFVDVKSVEVSGIAEKGPFFGLKPSRSGFYFLIFPVWLLRK